MYAPDSATGWAGRVKTRQAEKMVDFLAPLLPPKPRILDVGCGSGQFAHAVKRIDAVYDAIEASDVLRKKMHEQGFDVTPEIVPPIERESGTYDLVYGSMFIENLPTMDEAGNFAVEARRVLKPGGKLVLFFPNYLTWGAFYFSEHYTHSFITTDRRVRHLLEVQGLRILSSANVLGWFWVRSGFFKAIARHAVNVGVALLHTRLAYWTMRYLGLGELHWKLRKTLFEGIVMVAEKPA